MLTAVQGLGPEYSVDLVCNRLDDAVTAWRKISVPLPRGPVLARVVLFTLLGCCAFWLRRQPNRRYLTIGTQGAYPFCDICYVHSCHLLFLTRYRSQIGGRALRRTARIFSYAWGAFTERIAFTRAAMIVVPSTGLARELLSVYGERVKGKVRVLANPVDTERFSRPLMFDRERVRRDLGATSGELLFSFCALGNFELKGLRLILEALSGLADKRAKLVVIGGQPGEVNEFRKAAERLGVAPQVHFAGLQSDIRPFLWASDAFLFPSAHESFSLVSAQAAAAGLPLLTTQLNGVEEFAIDGETGWMMARTADSIRATMQRALKDHADLSQMGEAARQRVLRYGVVEFQARWRQLIEEALSGS